MIKNYLFCYLNQQITLNLYYGLYKDHDLQYHSPKCYWTFLNSHICDWHKYEIMGQSHVLSSLLWKCWSTEYGQFLKPKIHLHYRKLGNGRMTKPSNLNVFADYFITTKNDVSNFCWPSQQSKINPLIQLPPYVKCMSWLESEMKTAFWKWWDFAKQMIAREHSSTLIWLVTS